MCKRRLFLFSGSCICFALFISLFVLGRNVVMGQETNNARGTWKLVWSDEFDYSGLPDSTRWSYDTRGNSYGWGNNEAEWYTVGNEKNAYVCNGILRITALKEDFNGKHYTSARLITKHKGDWLYGRIEVCAKLPAGVGTWPAIWMLPTENTYGGWPQSGEIDIMEHVGFKPDSVFATVHTGAYNHIKGTQKGKTIYLDSATKGFNVYALEWDEAEIKAYVNGVLYFKFSNNGSGSAYWPYNRPFYLILNSAIGGGLGGKKGIDDSAFPNFMDVDYVRVYQRR